MVIAIREGSSVTAGYVYIYHIEMSHYSLLAFRTPLALPEFGAPTHSGNVPPLGTNEDFAPTNDGLLATS